MARDEYGPSLVGNGGKMPPRAQARYRSYADVFRDRVAELDAAIQTADRDYAASYQTDWRPSGGQAGTGLDQSHFVFGYWLPFVRSWNGARAALLAGTMDPAAAIVLASWAARYNDLRMGAGASWGLETTAPAVMIRGDVTADQAPASTPWWKIAIGAGVALGAGYFLFVRPSIKAGDRRLAEARQLASDVGLRLGMTQAEQDAAWDAYYKKRGSPEYMLSTAPKATT